MFDLMPEDILRVVGAAEGAVLESVDLLGSAGARPWADDAAEFYEMRRGEAILQATHMAGEFDAVTEALANLAAQCHASRALLGLCS